MALKKKNHKCKKEIGFIWIDGDFFNYSFEEEIKNYPYTLSVFEKMCIRDRRSREENPWDCQSRLSL